MVEEARPWDRTPYHHAARLKGVGVDCAMLLAEVYERAGVIPHVTPEEYPADWHLHRDEERLRSWVERYAVPTQDPGPGDTVLYRFGRCFSHAAIILAWPDEIIHAVRRAGKVLIERGDAGDFGDPRPRLFYTFEGTAK